MVKSSCLYGTDISFSTDWSRGRRFGLPFLAFATSIVADDHDRVLNAKYSKRRQATGIGNCTSSAGVADTAPRPYH
jgi:hypothetical protein